MPNNMTLPPQGTGDTTPKVATDNIGGVHYQFMKLTDGTVGNSGVVSITSNSLNVNLTNASLAVTDGGPGGSLSIDGTVGQSGTWTVGLSAAQTLATVTTVGTVTTITNVVHVDDNGGSLTVDNGGTFAVQDSQKIADNAGFTDGTSLLNPGGYIFDEVAGTALTENDIAAGRIDAKRAQVCVLEDETTRGRRATVTASKELLVNVNNASLVVTDGGPGGSLSIDGSVGQSGTWTVGLSAAQTLATLTSITNVVHVDDNSSTLSIDDGGGSITVDGTVTISDGGAGGSVSIDGSVGQSGTWTVGLSAAQTLATVTTVGTVTTITNAVTVGDGSNSISVSTSTAGDGVANALNRQRVASFPFIYNGSTWDKMPGNPSGLMIQGVIANGTADVGNPIKVGGVGASGLATLAAGTHGARLNLVSDTDGVQIAKMNCPFSDIISERLVVNSAANNAFTKFNASTGKRNYITTMSILNSSSTNTYVHFKDGNGGNSTIFFTAVAPAGGGAVITFPTPLRQPTSNTALNIEWDTAVASGFVSLVGFQSQQ